MKRTDIIGVVAAFTLGAFIVVVGSAVAILMYERSEGQQRYRECVASIPTYLDATEILYQEQECRTP